MGGPQAHGNSVLSQKLVVKLHRRLPHGVVLRKAAAFKPYQKSIVAIRADKIAVSDVGVTESKAHRPLTVVPKEPVHLSEALYGTATEAESLRPRLTRHVDVEIIETIIAIEGTPHKA
jgi:hypothetical protein